jgi:NAD(P)H dehydrogenase (quinone)
MADLAAEVSAQAGKPIVYENLPVEDYAKMLADTGLPEQFAEVLADTSLGIARGDWYTDSTDLERLLGRPTTQLADAVAARPHDP